MSDEEERELTDALLRRAADVGEDALPSRCAWCGRYRVGDRWLAVEALPQPPPTLRVSHGICPECVAALRETGMSV